MALVVEYHEELEADLLPDYDLLDIWRGLLSFRRLWVLMRHLPATSMFKRAVNPDLVMPESWGQTDELIATLVDRYTQVHFKNPKPYPRPAEQAKLREQGKQRAAALVAQAARIRARKEPNR